MSNYIPIGISLLALAVSIVTAWLSFFRIGELKMTKPTVIFLGPDGNSDIHMKIYIRTLLYSTAKRGQIIESLFVSLQRGESKQSFPIWTYGEDRLTRGSGLFVPQEGVAYNHHFLLPEDGTNIQFLSGDYILKIYAKRANKKNAKEIGIANIRISQEQAKLLEEKGAGIYFDWGAENQSYHSHVENRRLSLRSEIYKE